MTDRRPALGKGLSALIPDAPEVPATPRTALEVDIDLLEPNDYQPRGRMEEARLEELAHSIRTNGIIQPIVVRRIEDASATGSSPRYQIIAGERRWRAAQRAGLHEVPVVVREIPDVAALEIAIVENVQRADLGPLEEARGYRRLMDEFAYTQEKVAAAIGRSRSHVANLIRLLALPDEVQAYLESGQLSAGHARALITAADPVRLARRIVEEGLSVREAEALAAGARKSGAGQGQRPSVPKERDADIRDLESRLSNTLGMSVSIRHSGRKGELRIAYAGFEQLDALIQLLEQGGLARGGDMEDEEAIDDEELAEVLAAELGALREE